MKKLALATAFVLILAGCSPAKDADTHALGSAEKEPVMELFQPIPPDIEIPVTWDNLWERSEELSEIVYDDVYATVKRNKETPGYNDIAYQIYRGPNLEDFHYKEMDSWLDDLFALYANSVQPDNEIYIMFPYKDLEWAVDLLSDPRVNHQDYEVIIRNANQDANQGARQNAVPGMTPGTWQGIWVLPATLGPEPGNYRSFAEHEEATVNHEYAHQAQHRQWKDENLDGPNFGMNVDAPCFLWEGMASIPERTLTYNNFKDSEETMDGRIRGAYLYDPKSADELGNFTVIMQLEDEVTVEFATDYLQTSFEPRCAQGNQYALGYSLGYLATEGLVAIGGVESVMELLTRMGKYDITWDEAFSGIYGISWDQALPILGELVSKRYKD